MVQKWIGILFLFVVSIIPGLMQESTDTPLPAPSMSASGFVYEPEPGILYEITAEGVTVFAELPELAAFAKEDVISFNLSPDYTKLFFTLVSTGTSSIYYIADLTTGSCCQVLDPQDDKLNRPFSRRFSPDGAQFAVSYGTQNPSDAAQVVIFDVATGDVVSQLDGSRLMGYCSPNESGVPIVLRLWTQDGILLSFARSICAEDAPLEAQIWNPMDDSLKDTHISMESNQGWNEKGERIRVISDSSFPLASEGGTNEGNVVVYFPRSLDITKSAQPYVIYFNPNQMRIPFSGLRWVANGNAFLIEPPFNRDATSTEATVLLRDGTQIAITTPGRASFYRATSDGWIGVVINNETMTFIYFRIEGQDIEQLPLDMPYTVSSIAVSTSDTIDSTADEALFPPVAAP